MAFKQEVAKLIANRNASNIRWSARTSLPRILNFVGETQVERWEQHYSNRNTGSKTPDVVCTQVLSDVDNSVLDNLHGIDHNVDSCPHSRPRPQT